MINLDNYRIRRIDPKNIAIQRFNGKRWIIISYHGNSLNSLISGLFELIIAQHTPEADNLRDAVLGVKLDLVKGIEEVKELIENRWQ